MLTDYKKFVLKKAAPGRQFGNLDFHLTHAALGICTELLELQQSTEHENTCEELGDLAFYMTLAAAWMEYPSDAMEADVSPPDNNEITMHVLVETVEEFASCVKKMCFYGNETNLGEPFREMWQAYRKHLKACNVELEIILVENQMKLDKRYKDSFSPEEAAARRDKV